MIEEINSTYYLSSGSELYCKNTEVSYHRDLIQMAWISYGEKMGLTPQVGRK